MRFAKLEYFFCLRKKYKKIIYVVYFKKEKKEAKEKKISLRNI